MEFGNAIKITTMIFRLAAVLLLFYLSFTLFSLALQINKTQHSQLPFYNILVNEKSRLQKETDLTRQQLGFMVFDKEKNQLRQSLIKLLQTQINLYPFDSALWRQLSYLQMKHESNRSAASQAYDRQWTFLVSKQLLQWNKHERPFLLSQCLRYIAEPLIDVNRQCKQLFDIELQEQSQSLLLKKLKLSPEQWQVVIEHYSLAVNNNEG